ncbi:sigma 54-interacting transcriptional regulator [Sedimentibacter sp. LTW-03]|uniref:sigma 54-interacting transcriptional regulator n=1 Tax=Sedimentibacter sp. LTW-03 TaxID=3453406 RepID=UPI003F864AAF
MFIIYEITAIIINKNKHYIEKINNVLNKISVNTINCSDFDEAEAILQNESVDYVISDLNIFNEVFTIKTFTETYHKTDLIIVSEGLLYACGNTDLFQGALDYMDFESDLLKLPIKILEHYTDKKNNDRLKEDLFKNYHLSSKNEKYLKVLSHCEKVAKTNLSILLIGEPGTGKEVLAKYIHACSPRVSNKFIALHCNSYPEELLESELFGKEAEGRFELASNGTLFLNEVGAIKESTQTKLLKVFDTNTVSRIGSNQERLIDCKLVSSTSKDLYKEIQDGSYRDDFFYRISSIVINVPPLRERPEDLDDLIQYFLRKSQEEYGIVIKSIDPEAKKFLYTYDYPGNLRELKTVVDRMVVLSIDGRVTKDGIPLLFNIKKEITMPDSESYKSIIPFKEYKRETEATYLQWVLNQTQGNVTEAAKLLEISSRQLFNKINEYDLKK